MNKANDFHKKKSGVIVNTNRKDFQRARNRNFIRKEQNKIIGENGKIAMLEKEVAVLKALIIKFTERR